MGRKSHKFPRKLGITVGTLLLAGISWYLNPQSVAQEARNSEDYENIKYTRHAQCRMECRFFTEEEIEDVIENGEINLRKSDQLAKPCPVTAKEKLTIDGQRARVVYARCGKTLKIITAIDLGKKHNCHCP